MLQVDRQSAKPGAKLEAGELQSVDGDRGQPGERDLQGVVVQQRNAQKRQRKKDEIDRDAE